MPLGVRDVLAEWIAQNTQNEHPLDTGKKEVEPVLKVDKPQLIPTDKPELKVDRPDLKNEKDSNANTGKNLQIIFLILF